MEPVALNEFRSGAGPVEADLLGGETPICSSLIRILPVGIADAFDPELRPNPSGGKLAASGRILVVDHQPELVLPAPRSAIHQKARAGYNGAVFEFTKEIPVDMSKMALVSIARLIAFSWVALATAQTTRVISLPPGRVPEGIGINPNTNTIYVTHSGPDSSTDAVMVIDGNRGSLSQVRVGSGPDDIAINVATNKIYVCNRQDNSVTVIDGNTNSPTTAVRVGKDPISVAVNQDTNKIYVANSDDNSVTLIDGKSNVTTDIKMSGKPHYVAVNSATNKIYVASSDPANITVIDGKTDKVLIAIPDGDILGRPFAIAIDNVRNKIYVTDTGSNDLMIIDGATSTARRVPVGRNPHYLAVNTVTNKVYVPNLDDFTVTVIDGATLESTTVRAGFGPTAVAVDSTLNKIYVTSQHSLTPDSNVSSAGTITIIDGATNQTARVPAGDMALFLAVNPVTHKVYVVNEESNDVLVLDATSVYIETPSAPGSALTSTKPGGLARRDEPAKVDASDSARKPDDKPSNDLPALAVAHVYSTGLKGSFYLALEGRDFWVADLNGNVKKISQETGATVLTRKTLASLPGGLVFDGTKMWLSTGSDFVNTIGIADGTVRVVALREFLGGHITFDGKNVWVAHSVRQGSDPDAPFTSGVAKLSVTDGKVLDTMRVGPEMGPIQGLAAGGDDIWVATGSNSVIRIRASDDALLGVYAVGNSPGPMAFDGDNVWVVNGNDDSVTKLRARDGLHQGTIAVGRSPSAIVFDGRNVWITNAKDNSLTELRASDGKLLGTFRVGEFPTAVATDGAYIWVVTGYGSDVTKYDLPK